MFVNIERYFENESLLAFDLTYINHKNDDSTSTLTTDNLTLTLAAHTLYVSDGSISHLIICPGNEAGDATTCASEALKDRGAGVTTSGIGGDNGTNIILLTGVDTSIDFNAIRGYDSEISQATSTATKAGNTLAEGTNNTSALNSPSALTVSATPDFVAGLKNGDTDNVTVIPFSSSAENFIGS